MKNEKFFSHDKYFESFEKMLEFLSNKANEPITKEELERLFTNLGKEVYINFEINGFIPQQGDVACHMLEFLFFILSKFPPRNQPLIYSNTTIADQPAPE